MISDAITFEIDTKIFAAVIFAKLSFHKVGFLS